MHRNAQVVIAPTPSIYFNVHPVGYNVACEFTEVLLALEALSLLGSAVVVARVGSDAAQCIRLS